MPLINLKTDLKSLKFGQDRKGGGSSNQPYIKSPIPEGLTSSSPDFLLRNGYLNPISSANDVSRLTQMFFDLKSPNGVLFTAKQNLLSRTAVKTQTSNRPLNDGIYNPLSTISQAGVTSAGYHLNKQGINPFEQTGAYSNNNNLYYNAVKNSESNRLLTLKENTVKVLDPVNLFSYPGGPGSNLGVGNTNIKFSTTPFGSAKTLASPPFVNVKTGDIITDTTKQFPSTFTTTQLQEAKPNSEVGKTSTIKQDFRSQLRESINISRVLSKSPSYLYGDNKTVEGRINLENPADKNRNLISYTSGSDIGPVDRINALPIYQSENVTDNSVKNDLVKFRIAVINNQDPNKKTFIHFRAFLGAISDNFNATWNPTKYLGRGEDFYTYNGFTRTVSLSWTIAAQSKEELIPMYRKLNYLASTLTPDYSDNGYMKGNLVQLTIGGYFYEQPGIITGMNISMTEDSTWEIGIDDEGGSDNSVKELTHIIRVEGFSFTPIHNFRPSLQEITTPMTNAGLTDTNTYGPERYIALASGTGTVNNNYDN
jgi:hypothetical protein